ncbi:MAG: pantoate--beta-alanine ligase [Erythrobacter sp.]|nr:pantoate--beta-alanine ligase [Erythrobacter sp.]
MKTASTLADLRAQTQELRQSGPTIGLVPTMGALHEGHLALVRAARATCDHVVVSIFVNPTQFGPNEDLERYPRQLAEDCAMLEVEGAALVWAPDIAEMYPPGFSTTVSVGEVSEDFCGASRPGHFDGVATVVLKLFNQVQPDMAFFGEKDFQQLAVIRTMARDLDLVRPHVDSIIGVPIVREADGLAMSSRNRYLSPVLREAAAVLPLAMQEAVARIEDGQNVTRTLAALEDEILGGGFDGVDYAELADAETLKRLEALGESPARLLVAARIGGTRLIDNLAVGRG